MTRGTQRLLILAVILGGGAAGWWLTRVSYETPPARTVEKPAPPRFVPDLSPPKESKRAERQPGFEKDTEAADAGALQNQRSLRFSDRAALERFLEAAKGKGIAILGRIDRLNALHVGFLSAADLAALLDGTEETGFIYPVTLPTPRADGVQEGAVGFGGSLLSWLGVSGDNSSYGAGVRIGILDTGSTLPGATNHFLVEAPADAAGWNGHGTAVADLISQIAPAAALESWRIANDDGESNSFLLAQGILAAVEARMDILNISMASYGNSAILHDAVKVAQEAGVRIFASGGNEGYDQVAYPAAYEGVAGVGAVDANGNHLNFSNTGAVTLAAPGLDLVTAWTGGQSVYFTGTSASSPIGAAVLAAAISHDGQKISTEKAYETLIGNLNEAGAPGDDDQYGGGTVDLGRMFRSGTAGISDAAVASNFVSAGESGQMQLQVTVENRGTATIYNAPLQVTTQGVTSTMTITSLKPGDIATYTLPFSIPANGATVQSQITLTDGSSDLKPSNNRRSDAYAAPTTN